MNKPLDTLSAPTRRSLLVGATVVVSIVMASALDDELTFPAASVAIAVKE